jgi:Rhodanese-related sulfurtransferase
MTWQAIVSAEEVAERLEDARLRVFDCRYDLMNPDAGRAAYRQGHLPGAIHADLHEDLAGPRTARSGRHPLPDPGTFAAWLRRCGVDDSSWLLAYDDASGAWASRFWWMTVKWLGHPHVAVLDGGLRRWLALGLPVTDELAAPGAEGTFVGRLNPGAVVDAATAGAAALDPARRVLDARAPERYRGEVEPIDAVAGHIPGARNHPAAGVVSADGTFLPPARLRAELSATLGDVDARNAIAYCGSGVTACHLLLGLERAGLPGARLYAGSWSEWSSDPSRPVARGSGS